MQFKHFGLNLYLRVRVELKKQRPDGNNKQNYFFDLAPRKPYIELQQLMERKGYNQKELAAAISRRLNGYSPATLSNRLNGKAPFPVDEIVVIGELLSISPDEMYGYFIKPWAIRAKRAKKNPAKSNRLVSFGA